MIPRTSEQKQLENLYQQPGNQLAVVYGRKGCGMDDLLRSFCEGKKFFYHKARNASAQAQLNQLKREVESTFNTTVGDATFDGCFNKIKSGDSSKLVVIIDDADLLCRKGEDFVETMLKLRARRLYPGPVMILLCSTYVSWCKEGFDIVFGEDANKIDATIELSDVGFLDVVRAFPDYSVADCTQTYGILGGVPGYLNKWDGKASIKENVCKHILSADGFLYNEAEAFLASELRELSVYETILASIAAGNEKLGDLFADTGYSRAKISVYMKNLASFGVVEKVDSIETGGWDNAKKADYSLSANYVNIWFTFVYPNLSDLYLLAPEEFYDKNIAPKLDDYMNNYFVDVCTEYLDLINRMGKLPLRLTRLGTWVGKRGTIDIIGQDTARCSVVGLCNWSQEEMTMATYTELLKNTKRARISAEVYYLFSAKSFDEKLVELSKTDKRVVLVDMTEL